MRLTKSIFTLILLISLNVSANDIVWKTENPFRFVKGDATNNTFVIPESESTLSFLQNRMSKKDRDLLPPYDETYWNKDYDSERRLPIDYLYPKLQKVSAKLQETIDGLCSWEYQTTVEQLDCSDEFIFNAITQFGEGSSVLKVTNNNGESFETKVVVTDRLILGLGDSYGSGEGNPDVPTLVSESGIEQLAQENTKINTTGRWMKHEDRWVAKESSWLDRQCHRSFFSQHILAALKISSRNPHESVTVMPLACSGAEVLDGLLIPQKKPAGGGEFVKESQVNFAVRHLCVDGDLHSVKKAFYRGYSGSDVRKLERQKMLRCDGKLRKPDAILLSIGGNDVGFARAIAWATLPHGSRWLGGKFAVNITNKVIKPVCPKYTGQKVCSSNKPVAVDRVKYWLPDYYQWLSEQLIESGLLDNPSKVYLTAYPNPTFIEDGETYCGKDRSTDIGEQARTKLPRTFWTQRWDMGISKSEMHDINVGLINPLDKAMRKASNKYGWTYVDSHVDMLNKNGICAGYERLEKSTPLYPHIRHGVWYPQKPSKEWAYDVDRLRWFRNTNDSVLFEADSTDSDMNGAFHPDFRTHALIADELAKQVKFD